ncbi:MAG: PAS domain-containing protein [Ardenticatenaceae bacterium]|nr:PAS domain-containing protein [Ardenticatenaceae bacterium]
MPVELWGATGTLGVSWPQHLIGSILLVLYGLILLTALYHFRHMLRQMSGRQWALTAVLSLFSLLVSQLFPIRLTFDSQLAPLSVAQNPVTAIVLFAAAPFLLAGVALNPAAAIIVGMFSGLGRAIGQSHYPFDIFNFALAAGLASLWMRQSYQGRFYSWLRQPIIAGALNSVGLVFWIGVATFAGAAAANSLAALDLALSTAQANTWPLLIEGAVGGAIVMLVLLGLPQLKPALKPVPSPAQLSLRHRLLNNFLIYAAVITLLSVIIVFTLSINVSTRLVVNQMAHNAQTVSTEIPQFQAQLQNVLAQFDDEALLADDTAVHQEKLAQLFRINPIYRRVVLVDENGDVMAFYPANDVSAITLTEREETAVSQTLLTNTPDITPAEADDSESILSMVVPVHNTAGEAKAVLIGRVPQLSLDNLIVGLQGTVGEGSGFIVNEQDQIIAHANSARLLNSWSPPASVRPITTSATAPGIAYQGRQGQTNARELVYYVSSTAHPWTVVVNVPYEVVLNLAMNIGVPLTLVLLAVMGVFYANLALFSRDITNPLGELVQASKTITAGEKWMPSEQAQREDEIGQLNKAFYQMYQSRNKRLSELSLLLGISHEVSSSMDINQGMEAILRGALRGTGAAGARAVVQNPSGGYPLQFGEGPAARAMSALDRRLMSQLRHESELVLTTEEDMRRGLELSETAVLPVAAFIAIPLTSNERFQGILWLGYRQPHEFDPAERSLLHTLAGQAAVLVENARLFSTAEGGRRRLAAVLASTTEAVIVTDQTNRILLVNRAMEKVFNLNSNDIIGRPVKDVIPAPELVAALAAEGSRARNLEIPSDNGRTYYANLSDIYTTDGQEMGRVAVLHDITRLKEVDELKTEFVRTVSHDLKNPLAVMRGYTTMLPMAGEMNPGQEKYLKKIETSIDRMEHLVTDLLDLGRIEAGVGLQINEFDVLPLLEEIAHDYWQHAHLEGLKIKVAAKPNLPTITGDRILIRQAIANLIINAIKYAPQSGEIILQAESINGEIVFGVQDFGPGIPPESQIRLFEKFYRVKQKGEERKNGSGLGLAIVKSIAERHGGRAWCHSTPGQGSTFYFSIPLSSKQNGSANGHQ